jgi:hypothetical protein
VPAPAIEHRVGLRDREPAGEGLDRFPELASARLRDTEVDDALNVLRVGGEGGLCTGDGAGVGLRAILEESMLDIMYEIPSETSIKEVVITEEVILNNAPPILVYRTEEEINRQKNAAESKRDFGTGPAK